MTFLFLVIFLISRFTLSVFEISLIYDFSFLLEIYPNLIQVQSEYAYINFFCMSNGIFGFVLMIMFTGYIFNKINIEPILAAIIIRVIASLIEILFYKSSLFIIIIWLELIFVGANMLLIIYYNKYNFRKKNNQHKFFV